VIAMDNKPEPEFEELDYSEWLQRWNAEMIYEYRSIL